MAESSQIDLGKLIEVQYFSGGKRVVTVRWPTDAQWCERNRKQKVVERALGRGKTERETLGVGSSNAELLAAIRHDDGEPLDEAEASQVITRLERSQTLSCEIEGDQAVVELRALNVTTRHALRLPKASEIQEYLRASQSVRGVPRGREFRPRLEPAGELYDRLLVRVEGYAQAPPIIHQEAVLDEIIREIDRIMDDDDPEA